LFVVLGKIIGAKYHEPSAQDARRRIVSFFKTHLGSETRRDPATS
jgi:hypothetical protein